MLSRSLHRMIRFLLFYFFVACADGAISAQAKVTPTGYEVFEPVISMAWLNNNELLFAGSKSAEPDPRRVSFGRQRFYIWNHDSKTIRAYGEDALAQSFCYAKGRIRYVVSTDNDAQRTIVREGPLGAERTIEIRLPSSDIFSKFTCRTHKQEEFKPRLPRSHTILILREGDGYLALRPNEISASSLRNITLFPANGQKSIVLPITWDERVGGFGTSYSEYRQAYILPPLQKIPSEGPGNWPPKERRIVYLLWSNGTVERVLFPASPVFVFPRPIKNGWVFGGGSAKEAGLDIFDGEKVTRLERGAIRQVEVSPDGCRAAVAIANRFGQQPQAAPVNVKVFEFCTRGK